MAMPNHHCAYKRCEDNEPGNADPVHNVFALLGAMGFVLFCYLCTRYICCRARYENPLPVNPRALQNNPERQEFRSQLFEPLLSDAQSRRVRRYRVRQAAQVTRPLVRVSADTVQADDAPVSDYVRMPN